MGEIFLLVAFLSVWRWAMTVKMRALVAALGGGFWTWCLGLVSPGWG